MKQFIFITFLFSFLISQHSLQTKEKVIIPAELEPKIGLALSGGGSRGVAQIGVLKVFKEAKIPIYAIAGTSIGAFVGGLYAVGYTPEEMEEIALSTNWENVIATLKEQERSELFFDQKLIQDRTFATLRFKNFKFVYPQALSLGWKFNSFIQKLILNGAYYSNDFNKLKVPFRAVATDVSTGKTISIREGNLITAMRASSAIPLLNAPIHLDTMILVDGGLFANLPVEQVYEFSPDIIIGINTTTPIMQKEELNKPWTLASQIISHYMNRYFIDALGKADIVITPEIGNHPNDNFKGLDTLISKGEEIAKKLLPKIQRLIEQKRDSLISGITRELADEFGFPVNFALLKVEGNESQKEVYRVVNNGSGIPIKEFLRSLDKEKVRKVIFKSNNGELLAELINYPEITEINISSQEHLLKQKADSISAEYLRKYDNPYTRREIAEVLKKLSAKNGFSFVKINYENEDYSGRIKINIVPNKIRKIEVDPQIHTSEYIIRRDLVFKQGDITNAEKITKSWTHLINSGLFSDLFIDLQIDTANSACDVYISANERGTQVVNLILRIDNEKNLQGGLDIVHENLFNSGTRLVFSIIGCKTDFLTKLNLTQSRIWKTDFSFSAESYYYYRQVPIFRKKSPSPINRYESSVVDEINTEKYNINFNLGTQIERLGTLFVGIKYEKQRYYEINEAKPSFYNFNNLIFGLAFDSRDKADFSSSGRLIKLSLELPLFKTGRAIQYTKAVYVHSHNLSIKDVVFRPTFTFGFADNGLPFPDFFSLGGDHNFYGLSEDEFLGRQIFSGRFEVQYRLPFKIYFDTYITLSYDLGSVWEQFDVIKISDMKHGIGFSLGLDTPIGPVRFSAGKLFYFLKNPNATVWGPTKLYFSIGSRLF